MRVNRLTIWVFDSICEGMIFIYFCLILKISDSFTEWKHEKMVAAGINRKTLRMREIKSNTIIN